MDDSSQTSDGRHAMIQDESKQKPSTDEGYVVSTPKGTSQKIQSKRAGRWSPEEKLLFLHGLRQFGRGRWKKIQTFLPSRSLVQIKSHAQKVCMRLDDGEDIFTPLRDKASLLDMLLAKRTTPEDQEMKPNSPRRLPKLKLKPKPQPRHSPFEDPSHDVSVLLFRNDCRESGSPVFRTNFGASNLSFSFRSEPLHPQGVEVVEAIPSPTSVLLTPTASQVFLTPSRPDPNLIKSTTVEAAAALCQLSSAWDKMSYGDQHYNVVSP